MRKYVDMYTPEQMRCARCPSRHHVSCLNFDIATKNDILAAAENPERCYTERVMPEKLAIDLEYVSKANLWTDIKLIFGTFKAIIVN